MNLTLSALQSKLLQPFRRRAQLALDETENHFLVGAKPYDSPYLDRPQYNRREVLEDCLNAWRCNPLARRLVELTSQYAAGGGMLWRCADEAGHQFLKAFWNERLNCLDLRLTEFSDELVRSGNLFILLSTDRNGMSYVRTLPTASVERINSRENDAEQELSFQTYAALDGSTSLYRAYNPDTDAPDEAGAFETAVLHYAVNRPAGAQWGEPDLGPALKWLARYAAWLEDRVRLNRFRNAFMYVIKARFANEAARQARQARLAANPPQPGSILVTDESEEWSVLSPKLEALDASTDGLAVKKMIAAGMGVPLHFLAEPESSTRTTAESAGGPTFRHFEERQRLLEWIVRDLLQAALRRRACIDLDLTAEALIEVHGADISARDNSELAEAGSKVASLASELFSKNLISKEEYLRLVYRFMGERVPQSEKQ
ncbi:MAG: hypothetical protein VB108_07385 [Anaerolineaceae bacterium]|nr:hypothetical protein [Anaerolineaceae bacterium]